METLAADSKQIASWEWLFSTPQLKEKLEKEGGRERREKMKEEEEIHILLLKWIILWYYGIIRCGLYKKSCKTALGAVLNGMLYSLRIYCQKHTINPMRETDLVQVLHVLKTKPV